MDSLLGYYCFVPVNVPDSAAQVSDAGRVYVMIRLSPPDEVAVICPVNVLGLALHWAGDAPVAVTAPDDDTVPESILGHPT